MEYAAFDFDILRLGVDLKNEWILPLQTINSHYNSC